MAIFHLDVKTFSRSSGQSAVASAAYRSRTKLHDDRIKKVFNYTKKLGVVESFLALPADAPDWADNREKLWNAVEAAETRKNSTVAREWLLALPKELSPEANKKLVRDFSAKLVERYGIAVDASIHLPGQRGSGENHHAHLLTSTRVLKSDGFKEKTRILDAAKTGGEEIKEMRAVWADLVNDALEINNIPQFVDPRPKAMVSAEKYDAKIIKQVQDMQHNPSRRASKTAVNYNLKKLFKKNGFNFSQYEKYFDYLINLREIIKIVNDQRRPQSELKYSQIIQDLAANIKQGYASGKYGLIKTLQHFKLLSADTNSSIIESDLIKNIYSNGDIEGMTDRENKLLLLHYINANNLPFPAPEAPKPAPEEPTKNRNYDWNNGPSM